MGLSGPLIFFSRGGEGGAEHYYFVWMLLPLAHGVLGGEGGWRGGGYPPRTIIIIRFIIIISAK